MMLEYTSCNRKNVEVKRKKNLQIILKFCVIYLQGFSMKNDVIFQVLHVVQMKLQLVFILYYFYK